MGDGGVEEQVDIRAKILDEVDLDGHPGQPLFDIFAGRLKVGGPDSQQYLARVRAKRRPLGQRQRNVTHLRLPVRDRRRVDVHRRRADERGHEQVGRVAKQRVWRVVLLQSSIAQHGHSLAEGHRLHLIVGDEYRRHSQPLMEGGQFQTHGRSQLRIQVGERLVHEEGVWLAHHGAADGHPLALAT